MKKRAVTTTIIALGLTCAVASAQDAAYEGANSCKVCHNKTADGAQFKQWTETKHSQAFEVLKSDEAKEVAKRVGLDKAPHEAADCLQCHVTGYDAEAKKAPAKIDMELGVQCETCHGPASDHVAEAKKLMFDKEKSPTLPEDRVHPAKETCLQCHNENNPTWDPERYTLPDGTKSGFAFEQAREKIAHPNPQKAEAEGD